MIRPFIDTLRDLNFGGFADELSIEQNKIVQAVNDNGKMGTITIKIKYIPNGDTMILRPEIKSDSPRSNPGDTVLFHTPENNLIRDNPNQSSFDLRKVKDEAKDTVIASIVDKIDERIMIMEGTR